MGEAARSQATSKRAQAHGCSFFRHVRLLDHQVDHRVGGLRVEFAAVGVFHLGHVTGKLNHGNLHAQTQSEVGNAAFAGDFG